MVNKMFNLSKYAVLMLCMGLLIASNVFAQTDTFIRATAWSNNGSFLAVAGIIAGESKVEIFDAQYQVVEQLDTNSFNVLSVSWSPDDTRIVATISSELGVAYQVWNVNANQILYSVEQEGETSDYSVYWHPFEDKFATVNAYEIIVRDGENGIVLTTFRKIDANTDAIEGMSWSSNGEQIFTISGQNTVRAWNAATAMLLWQSNVQGNINTLALSVDGTRIAVAGENGIILDASTGASIASFEPTMNFPVNFLFWFQDDRQVISAGIRANVRISDLEIGINTDVAIGNLDMIVDDVDLTEYGGRLVYATRSINNVSANLVTVPNTAGVLEGAVQIVVPDPSPERLQAIAEACDAPPQVVQAITQTSADVPDTLSAVVDTVEALPTETIPPGCAADLIAVAEAIGAQGE